MADIGRASRVIHGVGEIAHQGDLDRFGGVSVDTGPRFERILIEETDVNRTLDEIWDGCTLLDIYWEGIMLRDGFFIAIYLADNEYGLVFVIPDEPWVKGELRQMIEDTLDPPLESIKQEEFT